MDRVKAERRIKEILANSPQLWDWPYTRDTLAMQLLTVVDEAVEAATYDKQEHLTALSDPKNVDLREVSHDA